MFARIPEWSRVLTSKSNKILPFSRNDTPESDEKLLAQTPLFSEFSPDEITLLLSQMKLKSFDPDEVIFSEGDHCFALYTVKEGWISITSNGTNTPQTTVTRGEVLDQAAFFLRTPHSHTARAQGKIELWMVSDTRLSRMVTEEPAIGLKLGLTLGRGIAQFQEYLAQRLVYIKLFDNLSESQRNALTQKLTPQRYLPGEILFRSQDPPTGIFLIQRGKIALQDQSGRMQAELSPGSTLGERAVVYNQSHLYTAEAATEATVWLLSPADFFELSETQPDLGSTIQQNVTAAVAEDLAAAARIVGAKIDSLRVVGGSHHPMLKQLENVQHTLSWCRSYQPANSRPPS